MSRVESHRSGGEAGNDGSLGLDCGESAYGDLEHGEPGIGRHGEKVAQREEKEHPLQQTRWNLGDPLNEQSMQDDTPDAFCDSSAISGATWQNLVSSMPG